MNEEPKNQDELQRMLALKRQESPPPKFFKSFSTEVLHRLHEPEAPVELTPREKLCQLFESKPVLVCLSAIVICACLATGLVVSLRIDPPKPDPASLGGDLQFIVAPAGSSARESTPPNLNSGKPSPLPSADNPVVVTGGTFPDATRLQAFQVNHSITSAPALPGVK